MTDTTRPGGVDDPGSEGSGGSAMYMQLHEADRNSLRKVTGLVEGLTNRVSDLNTQLMELKERADEAERKRKARALSLGDVIAKLDESGLPAPSRRRVANAYEAGSDLDSAIGQEMELVDELQRSMQPSGSVPSYSSTSSYSAAQPVGAGAAVGVSESSRAADGQGAEFNGVIGSLFGEV